MDELAEENKENNIDFSATEDLTSAQNDERDSSFFEEIRTRVLQENRVSNGHRVESENVSVSMVNDNIASNIIYETEDMLNESGNSVDELERVVNDVEILLSNSDKSSVDCRVAPDSGENDENIPETDNGESEDLSESLLGKPASSNYSSESSTIHERSSKLLHMISRNSPVPKSSKFAKRRCGSSVSPSAGRVRRLMKYSLQAKPAVEKIEEIGEEDILTFSREIPSPLALPRSSILKRKLSDLAEPESFSPLAKVSTGFKSSD